MFATAAQFFPLILAPGVVALARHRWPRLHRAVDGLLVWLAVVGAAVLWSLAIALAYGEAAGPDVVRRGFLLGLLSACGHTLTKRWPKVAEDAAATIAEPTPENMGAPREVTEQDVGGGWGPGPSNAG